MYFAFSGPPVIIIEKASTLIRAISPNVPPTVSRLLLLEFLPKAILLLGTLDTLHRFRAGPFRDERSHCLTQVATTDGQHRSFLRTLLYLANFFLLLFLFDPNTFNVSHVPMISKNFFISDQMCLKYHVEKS